MRNVNRIVFRFFLGFFLLLIVSCNTSDDGVDEGVYVSEGNVRFKSVVKDGNSNPVEGAKNGQSEPLKTDFFEPLKKSFQTVL